MSYPPIVLTGTTGGLGSQVLKHLLRHGVPASSLTLALRDPARAPPSLLSSGARLVRADYADPASLAAAFAGAQRLLLVSSPGIAHAARVAHHRAAIDAARAAGVAHVFYTSLAFAAGADTSATEVMQAHLDTEAYLKASGLVYTIVREGIYAESWPLYLGARADF
jgi:uncharacterized protein YbjT (DUF2867 family)